MTEHSGSAGRAVPAGATGAMALMTVVALVAGCASGSGGSPDAAEPGASAREAAAEQPAIEEPATIYALGIPLNAVPRVGKCRIWRPGVSFTRQPGPGSCESLSRRVPGGAWLLRRRAEAPDRVELVVYGDDGPSLIRVFGVENGELVRERMPRR